MLQVIHQNSSVCLVTLKDRMLFFTDSSEKTIGHFVSRSIKYGSTSRQRQAIYFLSNVKSLTTGVAPDTISSC